MPTDSHWMRAINVLSQLQSIGYAHNKLHGLHSWIASHTPPGAMTVFCSHPLEAVDTPCLHRGVTFNTLPRSESANAFGRASIQSGTIPSHRQAPASNAWAVAGRRHRLLEVRIRPKRSEALKGSQCDAHNDQRQAQCPH